jgi:hypothetical protein
MQVLLMHVLEYHRGRTHHRDIPEHSESPTRPEAWDCPSHGSKHKPPKSAERVHCPASTLAKGWFAPARISYQKKYKHGCSSPLVPMTRHAIWSLTKTCSVSPSSESWCTAIPKVHSSSKLVRHLKAPVHLASELFDQEGLFVSECVPLVAEIQRSYSCIDGGSLYALVV